MPIETNYHVEPPWDRRMKVSTNGLCHMTMIMVAAMSNYGKSFKNLSLWNQKADDLET